MPDTLETIRAALHGGASPFAIMSRLTRDLHAVVSQMLFTYEAAEAVGVDLNALQPEGFSEILAASLDEWAVACPAVAEAWAALQPRFPLMAREFPDFDQATLPAMPDGVEDHSWHNDACPAFHLKTPRGTVRIWVDYADPAQREFPDSPRFGAGHFPGGATHVEIAASDDFEAVAAAVGAFAMGGAANV